MHAYITLQGTSLFCSVESSSIAEQQIELTDTTKKSLRQWAKRYEVMARSHNDDGLFGLGCELFTFLDHSGWASSWIHATGERSLEVSVAETESAEANLLLDLPWEILATKDGYLADDMAQLYVVQRYIGPFRQREPEKPTFSNMAAMFMAAAPQGVNELDFEQEEVAILDATSPLAHAALC